VNYKQLRAVERVVSECGYLRESLVAEHFCASALNSFEMERADIDSVIHLTEIVPAIRTTYQEAASKVHGLFGIQQGEYDMMIYCNIYFGTIKGAVQDRYKELRSAGQVPD
jgi:hypothetical protein